LDSNNIGKKEDGNYFTINLGQAANILRRERKNNSSLEYVCD
jgi:hypothetical protein